MHVSTTLLQDTLMLGVATRYLHVHVLGYEHEHPGKVSAFTVDDDTDADMATLDTEQGDTDSDDGMRTVAGPNASNKAL